MTQNAEPAAQDAIAALRAAKDRQRQEKLAARDALSGPVRAEAAAALAARGLPVACPPGSVVSGFWPIRTEMNIILLMRRLEAAGARLALPLMRGKGEPLSMRLWQSTEDLRKGVWGIREPFDTMPETDPDILLVPLAVFDRKGGRIGYGAGYYDRTLHGLRSRKPITAIGIAYAVQEAEAVTMGPHDERLDFVMTERETISCKDA